MLNQNSLDLLSDLPEGDSLSLREQCQLGAAVTRSKSTAMRSATKPSSKAGSKAPAKASWFSSLLSFGASKVGSLTRVAGKAAQIAGKYGIPLPLDKDIERLGVMKSELRQRSFEADDILSKGVPRMLAQKSPASDLLAQQIGTAARQAKALAAAVTKAIDAAQGAAQEAKRQILAGKLPAQATGIFLVKKSQADSQFSKAKMTFSELRDRYQKGYQETIVAPSTPGVKQYAQAAYQSAMTAGGQAASAAEWAGEAVATTARGVKSATPLLKYAPYAAVAAAALYVYSVLPKGRKE